MCGAELSGQVQEHRKRCWAGVDEERLKKMDEEELEELEEQGKKHQQIVVIILLEKNASPFGCGVVRSGIKRWFGASLRSQSIRLLYNQLPREKPFSQVHYLGKEPTHSHILFNMIRTAMLAVPFAFLLLAGVSAEGEAKSPVADEVTRSGGGGGGSPQGYSQQYHYNSYPSHDPYGYTYAGLSFDLSTGLFLALGAIIVLLALAAVIYPLLSKNSGYGDSYSSYGSGGGSSYGSYRSLNLANLSEKVLNGIERLYEAYNKNQ